MKKLFVFVFAGCSLFAGAQANKKAKMAPVFVDGYYLGKKNDTIRCKVQINPDDPTDFYNQFSFVSARVKKPKKILPNQTKAYGFDGRDFVSLDVEGQKLFAERLTAGRLRFYEYRFNGKVDGLPGVESVYYIRDTYAEGENSDLKEPRKLSNKFYKKALKPYLQDQPMLWSDLDKFTFDKSKVVQTINEFNSFYAKRGN